MTQETIAIIGGTGDLGYGLALRWTKAGVAVIIGSRDAAKAEEAAARVKATIKDAAVSGRANPDAAAQASVVVLAVPFAAQAAVLKSIKSAMKNAILIDATVPLAVSVGGKLTRTLGVWEGSAAQAAQELLPGVPVISAFHNVSASALEDLSSPLDCDVLVSGNDAAAKDRVFALVKLIPGLKPIDAGPLEMSRVVEGISALLIGLNRRYKVKHSGIRITGLAE
jgi:8-hydroxy-5-deazaflavin:NADPH oxidoreductase